MQFVHDMTDRADIFLFFLLLSSHQDAKMLFFFRSPSLRDFSTRVGLVFTWAIATVDAIRLSTGVMFTRVFRGQQDIMLRISPRHLVSCLLGENYNR